ncbi:unnamed protein product (macronuclear) [Paramecium tetraurelia]|uniref:ABC transporter family protein n=1 Tax=Paramecium tetraurelia TaxID=5888 RepID=A0D814_PARTE|nr:uncharacterized protein GSPATT00014148001 [Paramecium tetraurelia]CAK79181.1 unnamed protein product [Paramecium tetraurelia]|eukprot:XP_001446578.1 hypothetical protein (macronuclear) [Paramecium tetraurelia strain d4-2]
MDSASITLDNQQTITFQEKLIKRTTPWFKKLFFVQIYPIMEKAYKAELDEKEMTELETTEQSYVRHQQFSYHLNINRQCNLVNLILQYYFKYFLKGFLIQLIVLFSQLAMPFLTKYIIGYISEKNKDYYQAFLLISLVILVRIVNLLSMSHSRFMMKIYGYDIMSVISLEIMSKCLKISLLSNTEKSIGEIANLIQVDVQRLIQVPNNVVNMIIIPLQLSITLAYIYEEIGISVLVGIIIIILSIFQNSYVGRQIVKAQTKVLKSKDNRVKVTTEAFQLIKFIKINALEQYFLNKIYKLREIELESIKDRLQYFSINVFMGWLSPQMILSLTFGLYVLLGNELVPSKTFPIIGLLSILAASLQLLPISLNDLLETKLSLIRIQDFLNSDELMNDLYCDYKKVANSSLEIEQGNFYWRKECNQEQLILKNINIKVEKGKFVAIIGDVGSGKSSLIQSLLGEMIYKMDDDKPIINITGSIAYVGQKPWIQNATVQDNILFGKPFEENLYEQAIKYSCLTLDLEILVHGDQTMIGEKGINLSGGQKARISLARAIYSKAEIFLLDDPLSAVDDQVGNFILKDCFMNLLKGKTRILITHALNYCKHTDYIYLMQKGEVIEEGDYLKMQNNIVYQEIEKKFEFDVQKQENQEQKNIVQMIGEKDIDHNQVQIRDKKKNKSDLMTVEERKKGEIDSEVYVKYLQYKKNLVYQTVLLIVMIIWILSQIIANLWVTEWTSRYVSLSDHYSEITYFWVFLFLGVVQSLFAYIRAVMIVSQSVKSSSQIHNDMIHCLIFAPQCQFFERVPLGRIMNRLTKDINSLDVEIHINIAQFSTKISQILSNNLLSIYVSTYLLIFPLTIFFYICLKIQRLYMKASRELQRLELISRSPILSYFTQSLMGLTTIRAFCQTDFVMKEFSQKLDNNKQIVYYSTAASSWFLQVLGLASLIVNTFAIAYCILFTSNPSFAGLILTFAASLDRNVQQTVDSLSFLENNMISFERCLEYTKIESENLAEITTVKQPWPNQGKIKFIDYSVNYRNNLPLILKNLSFSVNSKEKIGIVGRTGAGKSSITLSILRILEGVSGLIEIDDVDISKVQLQKLRSSITTMLQDPVIFTGTIRQNLDPLETCSDEEVMKVIEECCLLQLINERNGLDTPINEGGDNLSAGEKQLICIARAILKKSQIVLIDEATANIDIETEQKIQQTIQRLFKDCTVLTIAHRINTILHCDKILVISKGELKEFGSINELLNNQSSLFYEIYQEAINHK